MTGKGTSEDASFESKITEVMTRHPNGVSDQLLLAEIPSMSKLQLLDGLNNLLFQKKIQLLRKGNQLVYTLAISSSSSSKQCKGSSIEEKIVFEAVERAGNNGASAKDLKYICNLPQPQITKILKALENKKILKSVTSTNKKKLFMLSGLEPSHAITGGVFFGDSGFEVEFVDVLADQCYKYLLKAKGAADQLSDPISQRNASLKSSKEICDYITDLNISKVKLSVQDIEHILNTLIFDDKIEKIVNTSGASTSTGGTQNFYKVSKSLISSAALMRIPCGVCPVFKNCYPGGDVSPATCVYMKEWLDSF